MKNVDAVIAFPFKREKAINELIAERVSAVCIEEKCPVFTHPVIVSFLTKETIVEKLRKTENFSIFQTMYAIDKNVSPFKLIKAVSFSKPNWKRIKVIAAPHLLQRYVRDLRKMGLEPVADKLIKENFPDYGKNRINYWVWELFLLSLPWIIYKRVIR